VKIGPFPSVFFFFLYIPLQMNRRWPRFTSETRMKSSLPASSFCRSPFPSSPPLGRLGPFLWRVQVLLTLIFELERVSPFLYVPNPPTPPPPPSLPFSRQNITIIFPVEKLPAEPTPPPFSETVSFSRIPSFFPRGGNRLLCLNSKVLL